MENERVSIAAVLICLIRVLAQLRTSLEAAQVELEVAAQFNDTIEVEMAQLAKQCVHSISSALIRS